MRIDNLGCSSSFYSLHLKLNKINKKLKSWNLKYHKFYFLKYLFFYYKVLELIRRIKKMRLKSCFCLGRQAFFKYFKESVLVNHKINSF